MKKKIKKIILNYLEEYYGESEKIEPCYDIEELASVLAKELKKVSDK